MFNCHLDESIKEKKTKGRNCISMETYSIIVRAFILCVELNFFECTEIHSNIVNMLFKKKLTIRDWSRMI